MKGFTLIELLVVVAIISLLSSVVMASINSAKAKGRKHTIEQNKRQSERMIINNPFKNKHHKEETKKILSQKSKEQWDKKSFKDLVSFSKIRTTRVMEIKKNILFDYIHHFKNKHQMSV